MAVTRNTSVHHIIEEEEPYGKSSSEFVFLAFKDQFVYIYGGINFYLLTLIYNNATFLPSMYCSKNGILATKFPMNGYTT